MTKHLGTEAKGTRDSAPCVAEASDTSKTAKHTPGPWFIHPKYKSAVACEHADGFRIIGHVERFDEEQWRANLNLFAVAPDMLAALLAAREIHRAGGDPLANIDWVVSAQTAIAKATGAAQ